MRNATLFFLVLGTSLGAAADAPQVIPWKAHIKVEKQLKAAPEFSGADLSEYPFKSLDHELWRAYSLEVTPSMIESRVTGVTPEGHKVQVYKTGYQITRPDMEIWVQSAVQGMVEFTFPSGYKVAIAETGFARVTAPDGKNITRYIIPVVYVDEARVTPVADKVLYEQTGEICHNLRPKLPNQFKINNVQIEVLGGEYRDMNCTVTIGFELDHQNVLKNRYRTFSVGRSGLHYSIFTRDSEYISKSSGGRQFHFFPREVFRVKVSIASNPDHILISSSAGLKITVDSKSGSIVDIVGLKFNETQPVLDTPFAKLEEMQGGWEILLPQKGGLFLDTGWSRGGAVQSMNQFSVFVDDAGARCKVKNERIFKLRQKNNDDVILIHRDDKSLRKFLKEACPELKF